MSPILHAGFTRFRQNRLGFLSFMLFACISLLSFGATFISNDKPLLVHYQQHYYFPVFKAYPETTFGGVFFTETDYRDPAVQQLIQAQGWMIWPIFRYAADTPNLALNVPVPSKPSAENWLGTDDQGRDVLARILYGLRISILFAFALTLASSVFGILIGAIQGYYAGWVDLIGQRVLEVWGSLPMLFMVMILVNSFSPNIYWLFLIMLFFAWTALVGLVRAEFLRSRNLDYVRAAKALGVAEYVIIWRHILPNVLSSSVSQLPFIFAANISALTALDFLGYGLAPDSASLGELLLQAKNNLHAPWLAVAGFLTLSMVLSLLICMGDAARDAFDPKQN
ncbi:ABC transporter permease [Acinetobacter sp. MD2(2019)]|uniref:ABC transporter permease n=1 Tax=Acinetobacter sp. MD2(2019) TaxID=2605273 RepID=UPI002D1E95FA|nr:ABC transporter permease [Acinetobacter sp. MD2(2019)]MEB3753742.1 ABC transporter permease [Acinetobacter sp. MD2(2019)]